ncbi:Asp23/Gls24 family envelope stress response protein [Streptomyces sp. RB6PN25]|uniref:Asp23/Gls24 family envelope stress response protein n=1 Tax=Streptomyces humicola TaxID=2953240 RepID=A0ABT1Q3N5_9ACTN|nr:Asp23/Gls24 family envelope stress response protein [Streptomyces humicola]MCQ4083390.1 Asp23/Gls24 family envelope stress response protein [Streptomyces humicola]
MSTLPSEAAPPPADRGATRIADRVVSKIASQAAREALGAAPQAEWVPDDSVPHASVVVRQAAPAAGMRGQARVRLSVEIGYPADIAAVCAKVRRHVVATVHALTGMEVPEVTVEVERLHSEATGRAVRGRVT